MSWWMPGLKCMGLRMDEIFIFVVSVLSGVLLYQFVVFLWGWCRDLLVPRPGDKRYERFRRDMEEGARMMTRGALGNATGSEKEVKTKKNPEPVKSTVFVVWWMNAKTDGIGEPESVWSTYGAAIERVGVLNEREKEFGNVWSYWKCVEFELDKA